MRPVQMSKVRIFIEQDEIAALINFLPTLDYVSVKEIRSPDEDVPTLHTFIPSEQMQTYSKKIQEIEEGLDFVTNALGYSKTELAAIQGKRTYKSKDLTSLVDQIHLETLEFRRNLENDQSESRNLSIEREKLVLYRAFLRILEQFHMTSSVLTKLHYFKLMTFSTPTSNITKLESEVFTSEITTFFYKQPYSGDRSFCLLICKTTDEERIRALIKIVNPEYLAIPTKYITEKGVDLALVDKDIEENNVNISRLNQDHVTFRKDSAAKILALREVLGNIRKFLDIEKQFIMTPPNTGILEIWTPSKTIPKVISALSTQFGQKIRVRIKEIKFTDVPFKEGYGKEGKIIPADEVPTLTQHNWFIRPFMTLLRLYGVPRYTEIDPTLFLAITFPLLFGIMFADVGHGIVLIIVGLLGMWVYRKKSQGIRDMGQIIMYCGFGTILGGMLMGEYFGQRIQNIPYLAWAAPLNIFQEPLSNIGFLFKAVLLIGVIHISLGWILQAANYSVSKRRFLAFADSGLKIALLAGGTYLIFTYMFDINAWMSGPFPPILFPLIPGLLLLFMRAIGKLFHIRYLDEESVGGIIAESSIQTMETFLAILSNVASYSRLMALGLSHLGLMLVVTTSANLLVGSLSPPWDQIFITVSLVFGNFLVILIETLIVFIHNMRLHFYEFFSKFYKGSGIPFKQFELAHKYSEIIITSK